MTMGYSPNPVSRPIRKPSTVAAMVVPGSGRHAGAVSFCIWAKNCSSSSTSLVFLGATMPMPTFSTTRTGRGTMLGTNLGGPNRVIPTLHDCRSVSSMSHPTEPFETQDKHDDDGAVIDSFFIEVDNAPDLKAAEEPIPVPEK